jgi:hypothetical protein
MLTMHKHIIGGLFAFAVFTGAGHVEDAGAGPSAGTQGAPDTPRSKLPVELAGDWFTGSLSTIQYYDRRTGEFANPSGQGFYMIFGAGGTYESGAVISSIVSGCEMRLLGAENGTASLAGRQLTLHRHRVTTRVTSTCGRSGDRTQGPATTRVTWSVDIDDSGLEWLSLTHENGSVERFRRWKR